MIFQPQFGKIQEKRNVIIKAPNINLIPNEPERWNIKNHNTRLSNIKLFAAFSNKLNTTYPIKNYSFVENGICMLSKAVFSMFEVWKKRIV